MTNFVNLTPHAINVYAPDGTHQRDLPVSGLPIARRAQSMEVVGELDGIQITRQVFGPVENLPASQEGTCYVVSRIVADACPDRTDLLIPGPQIRNDAGQPIGCIGLSQM